MDSLSDSPPMFRSTPKRDQDRFNNFDLTSTLGSSDFTASPRWNNNNNNNNNNVEEITKNEQQELISGQVDRGGFVTFKLKKGVLVDIRPDCSSIRMVNTVKGVSLCASFSQADLQPLQVQCTPLNMATWGQAKNGHNNRRPVLSKVFI